MALRRFWSDQVGLIADRGREILGLGAKRGPDAASLAKRLLAQRGEAAGLAIAHELAAEIDRLDAAGRTAFLLALARDFDSDVEQVGAAIDKWRKSASQENLMALRRSVEPPRQELFRRLNIAGAGTRTIVRLRQHLLGQLAAQQELRAVDEDMRHLLASWFNRGFLRLERIDWNTPAAILEKLIAYEAVHEIRGWDDLRGRLGVDRRCFAFFHPAMPDEPLIFVEVALTQGLAPAIAPLIDPTRAVGDPRAADTAIFFSISNCQEGLRGISFGNFLIKQVVDELQAELPQLRQFATLSPAPRLREILEKDREVFSPGRVAALLGSEAIAALERFDADDPLVALDLALAARRLAPPLRQALETLTLAYLTRAKRAAHAADPVAHFHLSNGARLERINVAGDLSPKGIRQSFGVMVNYLYDPQSLEANHERYVASGEVPLSRKLQGNAGAIARAWP